MRQLMKDMDFISEWEFKTSRSGGRGGQNVNKVSTKVELRFDIVNSVLLSSEQKELLIKKLHNRITKDGILHIESDSRRTQLANKKLVIKRFYKLLKNALKKPRIRILTEPTQASREKKLKEKKIKAEKKKAGAEIFLLNRGV